MTSQASQKRLTRAETHCFGLAQGYDKQRYELDVCQVDVFFKKRAQRVG